MVATIYESPDDAVGWQNRAAHSYSWCRAPSTGRLMTRPDSVGSHTGSHGLGGGWTELAAVRRSGFGLHQLGRSRMPHGELRN